MATIGKLNVKLNADTRLYLTKMRNAKGITGKFQAGLIATAASLKQFAAIAIAAAGAGLLVLGIKQLKAIDQSAKLADVLGTTIGKLEALRLAAKISGSEVAALDKSLQFLAKAAGEVTTGISTEATKAFDLIGISIKDLKTLDPASLFVEIAEGLRAIKDPNKLAAIAQRLLGRGGKDLVLTLKLGKEGLKAFRQEATLFGLNISKIQSGSVEAFNDSLTRLGAAFEGLGNSIAVMIAPFKSFIDRLTNGIVILNVFLRKATGQDVRKIKQAFGEKFGLTAADADRSTFSQLPSVKTVTGFAFNNLTLAGILNRMVSELREIRMANALEPSVK